jgi:hypothetical protein
MTFFAVMQVCFESSVGGGHEYMNFLFLVLRLFSWLPDSLFYYCYLSVLLDYPG